MPTANSRRLKVHPTKLQRSRADSYILGTGNVSLRDHGGFLFVEDFGVFEEPDHTLIGEGVIGDLLQDGCGDG